MPCYTIQYSSVEFKAKHISILIEAAKRLDYRPVHDEKRNQLYLSNKITIDLNNQQARIREDSQAEVNKLKQMYSQVGLESIAKKRKFILNMKKGTQVFEMRRY